MNSNDFACIYEFLKEEIEKEHLNIEKEHLGQKIFDQVQNRRNFAREEHRIRLYPPCCMSYGWYCKQVRYRFIHFFIEYRFIHNQFSKRREE